MPRKAATKIKNVVHEWLQAAQSASLATLKELREKNPQLNVDESDGAGRTALHFAAVGPHLSVAKLLIEEFGATVDAKDGSGATSLLLATRLNHVPMVKYLVEQKANTSITTLNGVTPLHYAADNGNEELIEYLLNHSASLPDYLKLKTKDGDMMSIQDNAVGSPLHWAASSNNIKIMQMLLDREVPVDLRDRNGLTPLHMAASAGHSESVKVLLEKNANVNLYLQGGATALHLASDFGHVDIVSLLLDGGAKFFKDDEGDTPWKIAQKNPSLVALYQEKRNWSDAEDQNTEFADKSQKRITELKDEGNRLFNRKQFQAALQKYEQALELDKSNHVLYSNISGCYQVLGEYEKALTEAEKCIAFEKKWPKGYYRQAIAEYYLKRYDECEETLKKGLEIAPTDSLLLKTKEKLEATRRKQSEEGSDK
mmetsp:Transcript_21944/g.30208  ORF Transcript_21944/g.30208 Transcript_21944/m.30208 type:complete len:426 (-) Transcript_21944:31-1308(-)